MNKSIEQLSILVVDDDEFIVNLTARTLESLGVTNIAFAENGFEAKKAIIENHYDLLLLDIHMPDMDGVEFINQVLKYKPEITFALISGINNPYTEIAATLSKNHKLNCIARLTKPVTLETLNDLLHQVANHETI